METLSQAPDRVVFGAGAESAAAELLRELGARRVLLVAQARHTAGAERIAAALGERSVGLFVTDQPQVPSEVADAASARARELQADWVLAHGGGTPIGIAKAIALQLPVKIAAVPTTYAGSERTNIWGLTRDARKLTGRDDRVRPQLVIYDPALMLGLDRSVSLDSAFNALAHALEALYAHDATDTTRAQAEQSLGLLRAGITAIAKDPSDLEGRTHALRGAALAAGALGTASMGLHHKLAHVLGGSLGTPHARTHATLLPYTVGFNAAAAPAMMDVLRRVWGCTDPGAELYDWQRSLGLATSLRTLGVTEDALTRIADEALELKYPNPRAIDRSRLLELLDDALHDRRPSLHTRRVGLAASVSGPHARMPVTVRGGAIESARVVVLALHGRGASADRFVADLERRLGGRAALEGVTFVAPQARDNTWYPKSFSAPVADNQPAFDSALSVVQALWDDLASKVGAARIVPVGFSQGACLLLTWLSQTSAYPRQSLAFTGAPTTLTAASYAAVRGLSVYLGSAERDPYISREVFEAGAAKLREAGASVTTSLVPTSAHDIHAPDVDALRQALVAHT